ncbi:DNA-binding helix-turn-helix protein [Enterococcus faecalis 13-SD-W-01]|nr:DNA-binding helix-turn-helix protein [Enterococcus faecalis 13-SD-W-01]
MYGQTLKKIREDKGLKQKDVCQNIVTLSYYSRIERNISSPTIDVFEKLIKNLNVGLEEFMYIHNEYKKPLSDRAWFELSELYHKGDIQGLVDAKNAILKENGEHNDPTLTAIIDLFIARLGGNATNTNIDQIIQRLMELENWTSREARVFITIMDELPIETLFVVVNVLLKKRNLYAESHGFNSPYCKILMNAVLMCIDTGYLREGYTYLQTFKNMLEIRDLFGKTMGLYLEGLLDYAKGMQTEGEKKITDAFTIFHLLDMENFAHKYKVHFEHIKEKYAGAEVRSF